MNWVEIFLPVCCWPSIVDLCVYGRSDNLDYRHHYGRHYRVVWWPYDALIMRSADFIISLPGIMLLILIQSVDLTKLGFAELVRSDSFSIYRQGCIVFVRLAICARLNALKYVVS